ncbi:hypothetical protein H0W80_04160 [Candidatus Saccharibacteria bacterium]|nr:hypothetical protein [Candidatus Saccharibacteria bacterium]
MAAKKTTKPKTPLSKNKRHFIDPTIIISIACIAIAGLIFVLYASAASVNSLVK